MVGMMEQAFIGNGRKVHDVTGHNTVACGRKVSWLSSTSEATDCQGCLKARKSGMDVLADLLSLDGTPAKIVTPLLDSQATLNEREAPHRAAFRAFTPTRCNRTYRHELCSVSNCTARLGDCEMCHEVSAECALTLDGSYVGSSGPVTKNASLYLCIPCYRSALASVNERGYGSITILWHAQRVIGEAIRYNDPQVTTRYAFLDMDRSDDAWNAAKIKAHQVEPGYAPTINSCLFYSPNANRAYQVTRNGVAGVEYMAPGAAYGLAWEVRHIGRDDTFACAEIDPLTGDVVEWIWPPRLMVGDVIGCTRGTWYVATVTAVSRESYTADFDGMSFHRPVSREMSFTEFDAGMRAGDFHIIEGN